jgi:hypothetical protein
MSDDPRDASLWDQSEFGLGEGMIDPVSRAERTIPVEDELKEIYALPKTFDNSMPDRPTVQETPVPRLGPNETEADRA